MKILYTKEKIESDLSNIKKDIAIKLLLAFILLFVLALFFTFYSLSPLRKALKLNDEFIKDILHDFNTPITTMKLNVKFFEDEFGSNTYVQRLSKSINNIVLLQKNLKSFLHNSPTQLHSVNVARIAKERLQAVELMYPALTCSFKQKNDLIKLTHSEILVRILSNILSNAAKYNKQEGHIEVLVENETVSIIDTGKGIQHVSKVFDRYYKEQSRGVGIGLHIVQKLCSELNIGLSIESSVGKGTTVILDFKELRNV